jgi:pentatricopeptide repeat protein
MEDIRTDGVHPNPIVFASLLKSCGRTGAAIKGQELHSDITKSGLEQEPLVGNMVVDMYANCGSLAEAEDVFQGLPVQDQVMWNVLISGYAQLGESEKAIHVFGRIVDTGTEPNSITFVSVLNACSHAGLLDAGFLFFKSIGHAFDLIPNLKHCTCMVDLLGRAGIIDKATELIDEMPVNPDMAVWLILLGACRKWNDVGLGRYAFEHAVQLYEGDSTAYVCMSNIYMNASMQGEAQLKELACSRAFHRWMEDAVQTEEALGWA